MIRTKVVKHFEVTVARSTTIDLKTNPQQAFEFFTRFKQK